MTEAVGHARELAKSAVRRGARLVMAWGGDGTINEVASALAFDEVPLGIVPAGSGNGLARELGVASAAGARDRRRAAGGAAADRPRRDRRPSVREHRRHRLRRARRVAVRHGDAARLYRLRRASRRARSRATCRSDYRITTGGVETAHRAMLVTIANSAQFGNNARIAPGARVDDGRAGSGGDGGAIALRRRSAGCRGCSTARSGRVPGCTIRRIREVTIEADAADDLSRRRRAGGGRDDAARPHPSRRADGGGQNGIQN